MYKLHLILKYLRKRRIAWVSLVAVMLCTTMVLVVISVMGGWLRMFRESFHGLSGDVIVEGQSLAGFPHYQEMIERMEALPEVAAAVPTIRTYGLVNIANLKNDAVQVFGYPLEKIGRVNKFPESLHRQFNRHLEQARDERRQISEQQKRDLRDKISFKLPLPPEDYKAILPKSRSDPGQWPGMIAGAGVLNIRKGPDGQIQGRNPVLYELPVKLTVLGISPESFALDLSDKTERNYWIVDDSRTQVWQYDSNTVYVPFEVLQRDLGMDEQQAQTIDGRPITLPPRTNEIHVSIRAGHDLNVARDRIEHVVRQVVSERQVGAAYPIIVETWEESQAMWLGAIEKEKALVTFLFGIISIVAIFLIFCIFYMIVVEKTKDIGIIKSVGATSRGVAGIFLGYGMAIGIVGGALGLLVGFLIVRNINYLHTKMGQLMGIQIWNPEVYAFDTIPNTMDPKEVAVIVAIAIISSVIGALVPAVRAARMHPVEALRWE